MDTQKVIVVGAAGFVGSTTAYAVAIQRLVDEVVLIDLNEELVWGQAADMNDAMGINSGTSVRAGSYADIEDNDIVVISAGAAQKPGQTRLDLLKINAGIMRNIIKCIKEQGTNPYIIVVANPVDVLTYIAIKESGLKKGRVFGSGTMLDTSRLKSTIAGMFSVNSRDVEAYILGEHGDSSFSTIESAAVGGVPLKQLKRYDPAGIHDIDQQIRDRAYRIIQSKGATYYGIGMAVSELVGALRHTTRIVYPVTSLLEGEYGLNNVAISVPHYISNEGVEPIDGYELSDNEKAKLSSSAQVISGAIASLSEEN